MRVAAIPSSRNGDGLSATPETVCYGIRRTRERDPPPNDESAGGGSRHGTPRRAAISAFAAASLHFRGTLPSHADAMSAASPRLLHRARKTRNRERTKRT